MCLLSHNHIGHQIHQYILTASEVLEDDSTDLYDSLLASVSTPLDRVKVLVSQLEGGSLDAPPSKKEKVIIQC